MKLAKPLPIWFAAVILRRTDRKGKLNIVLLGLMLHFPTDQIEREIPDARVAKPLLQSKRPDIIDALEKRRAQFVSFFGHAHDNELDKAEQAIHIALARMARRNGSLSDDFHHYHNEDHVMELLDRRIGKMLDVIGIHAMLPFDWLALSMFAACHDLRQREKLEFHNSVGNNEAASIAETMRILHAAGYDRELDANLFIALEIMIAGSTFDASPAAPSKTPLSAVEAIQSGGPLAWKLGNELDRVMPDWREHSIVMHALELALIASDIDTANVSESFELLSESGRRLAEEREMRMGRSLDEAASGEAVLNFLTQGQLRYFFDLHRFCSEAGRTVFADGKTENAARLVALTNALQAFFKSQSGFSARAVLAKQAQLAVDG